MTSGLIPSGLVTSDCPLPTDIYLYSLCFVLYALYLYSIKATLAHARYPPSFPFYESPALLRHPLTPLPVENESYNGMPW